MIYYMWVCTNTTGQLGSQSWRGGTRPVYIWGLRGVHRGCGSELLVAMEYYRVLIYNTVAASWGSPRWAHIFSGPNDADKGAMKAKGQARLEPPRTPGHASLDLCTCATGCRVHMVRGDGPLSGTRNGRRAGASSCFAACVLLCYLEAPLHP